MSQAKRDQIAFVCESPWPEVRKRATALLKAGGRAHLEEAATLVGHAEFRNKIPESDDFPDHLWRHLEVSTHPLGWMPARRIAIESDLPVWDLRSDGCGGCGSPALDPGRALAATSDMQIAMRTVPAADCGAAFESIEGHSNGKHDAACFTLKEPGPADRAIPSLLASAFAPLAPKKNAAPIRRVVSDRFAVQSLLSIAINGGAYDAGAGAALGRLGAWKTIRSLVTPNAEATFAEVAALVGQVTWIGFDVEGHDWFYNVAWDGCLACLNHDRLAVIAWSDTD